MLRMNLLAETSDAIREQAGLLRLALALIASQLMIIVAVLVALATSHFGLDDNPLGWLLYLLCLLWAGAACALFGLAMGSAGTRIPRA